MEATIFHHKFSILAIGRLHKLSSLPPPPVSRCNRTPHTLHQALAPTTITQQPTAPHLHRSSLHPHLEQLVLPSPHTHNSLKSLLALPHPYLFLPHHYLHSRLPLSLQHLTFYRLRPHLSHQCRHQSQQVAPAVGVVKISGSYHDHLGWFVFSLQSSFIETIMVIVNVLVNCCSQ